MLFTLKISNIIILYILHLAAEKTITVNMNLFINKIIFGNITYGMT